MKKACAVCDVEFEAKMARAKYCTQRCKDKGRPSAQGLACCLCGEPMTKGKQSGVPGQAAHNKCRREVSRITTHGTTGYRQGCRCETCKTEQAGYYRAYTQAFKERNGQSPNSVYRKRFAEANGRWPHSGGSDWVTPKLRRQTYERDNWTCQLCNQPVDRAAHWNDNYAPSLDHIVPRSHTLVPDHRPSNLRTAHRVCNSRRGATVDA